MTKGRFFFGLIILAVFGYLGLFVFDRWKADVWGKVAAVQLVEPGVLVVQVETDQKTPANPTGMVPMLVIAKTTLEQENYLRVRSPATVEALQLGQKILAQYYSPLAMPATPLGRVASQVLVVKW